MTPARLWRKLRERNYRHPGMRHTGMFHPTRQSIEPPSSLSP